MADKTLTGRTVLITGGASGIGAACARRLAADGARVLIADLDGGAAEKLAVELGQHAVQADVTRAADIEAMLDAAWQRWGRCGLQDNYARTKPKMITYAAAFDPEALKFVALQMLDEAGVKIRLHSTFVDAVVHDGVVQGGIFETKAGRQAITAQVTIDTSGDGDVFARVTQHAFHCPLQADRQIVLGGQRFGSREHALRRVEENRVGIGAAGIEDEEKGQWSAGLVRNGATFTMPPRKLKPRDQEAWIDARTAPPNELTSTRSMACCEGELHIGPGR